MTYKKPILEAECVCMRKCVRIQPYTHTHAHQTEKSLKIQTISYVAWELFK